MTGPALNSTELTTANKEIGEMKKGGGELTYGSRWRSVGRLLVAFAAIVALLGVAAASASAGAPRIEVNTLFPNTAANPIVVDPGPPPVLQGNKLFTRINVENAGSAPMSGTLTIKQTMPSGVGLIFAQVVNGDGSCEFNAPELTCSFNVEELNPYGAVNIIGRWSLPPDLEGTMSIPFEVSGGGAAEDVTGEETIVIAPPDPFQVESLEATIEDANAVEQLQAGASPGLIGNRFSVASHAAVQYNLPFGAAILIGVNEHPRNVIVHVPAGAVSNFAASGERCTAAELNEDYVGANLPGCPIESQIGVARIISGPVTGVYNMVPPPGAPAAFGFAVANVPVMITAQLRPSDFGVDLVTRYVSATLPIANVDVRLWGVPADSANDPARGVCFASEGNGNTKYYEPTGYCPSISPRKAFLRLPTSCNEPLHWGIEIDSYEQPDVYRSRETTTPRQVGCNQLDFTPSFQARPSTNVGDSPAGLELALHLPQNEDPDGLAEAHLKDLTLDLPEGLTVNTAAGDGLGACTPAQIGLLTPVGQVPAHFNGEEPQCPDASKVGAVVVNTPAIDHPLPGKIFLASQQQNPYGSLLALYLVIHDPPTGVIVKVPIKATLDPQTGQISTAVIESPQLPFEDLSVELDQGAHAALRTPVACGKFTSASTMTPWSSPEAKDVSLTDSFEIVKGAGGEACVASEAAASFDPKFTAGTLEPKAGAYSPFVLKLTRADGTQNLRNLEFNLPKGLLANLRGIPYCSEAAISAVPTGLGTGAQEMESPSCPAASQIGTVSASVGAGPAPLTVRTGRVYWTGPYEGTPVSIVTIFPAVAGPFDLGNVVTRIALHVDPETAQITAKSDPLPTMLYGIPVDIRALRADLDRPNYTFNPTSCDPMSFDGVFGSSLGVLAQRSDHFQVGGCANLRFKPKLRLRLQGGTARGAHPALRAKLTFPKRRGANIARASVALPHSEFLDQAHIGTVCTRVQFAAHQCPARSIYGYARAYSPILDYSLQGPVYLRSSSHKLPDLVADLNGEIEIAVVGRIDTDKTGGIRSTFESVPDAPVSKFVLNMKGGKKGLLQNSVNVCRGTHKATALFTAQNGLSVLRRPELESSCPKPSRKHRKHSLR